MKDVGDLMWAYGGDSERRRRSIEIGVESGLFCVGLAPDIAMAEEGIIGGLIARLDCDGGTPEIEGCDIANGRLD